MTDSKRLTVPATPLTVSFERLSDEYSEGLKVTAWRGNLRVLFGVELERGSVLPETCGNEFSRDELAQINGLIIAEWLHWPATEGAQASMPERSLERLREAVRVMESVEQEEQS